MRKVTHAGWSATNGKLICGKRAATSASSLELRDVDCKSCLAHQEQVHRREANRLIALARVEERLHRAVVLRMGQVRYG